MKMSTQLTSIEGIASDVRQARSYQCLFRLSGKPVALVVDGPIFIEDGETVTVIGMYNQDGVFEASAYYNRSSGVSGKSGLVEPQQQAMMLAGLGGVFVGFVVFMALIMDHRDYGRLSDLLFGLFTVLTGLGIVLYGVMRFVRYRNKARAIERLLNEA